jgi:uncharacterized membrane protein YeaQ/YmgE (transglycosylase-associated protein family)
MFMAFLFGLGRCTICALRMAVCALADLMHTSYARGRTDAPCGRPDNAAMDTLVWTVLGGVVGWISYSRFGFNEDRGRNVSIILGAVGGIVGATAIAPVFLSLPAGGFSVPALFFAAAAASAVLALADLASRRWGV